MIISYIYIINIIYLAIYIFFNSKFIITIEVIKIEHVYYTYIDNYCIISCYNIVNLNIKKLKVIVVVILQLIYFEIL